MTNNHSLMHILENKSAGLLEYIVLAIRACPATGLCMNSHCLLFGITIIYQYAWLEIICLMLIMVCTGT